MEIITFIKDKSAQHQKVTISDLKKHLKVTHPTILSRLNQLSEKGLISLEKEGRKKYLYLQG